jgi:hypothetical protein
LKIAFDELWRNPGIPGMIIVTTNSVTNHYGLVMGKGSAGEAAQRIPGIRHECVAAIRSVLPGIALDGTQDYGFIVVRNPSLLKIGFGIFQAKRDWKDVSKLETIDKAVVELEHWAVNNPKVNFRMPFPGIGNGQMGAGSPPDINDILQEISGLPDNVTVCVRRRDDQYYKILAPLVTHERQE